MQARGYSLAKQLDRMIAAQALVHHAILITRNGADFRDVPGLRLLEWFVPAKAPAATANG